MTVRCLDCGVEDPPPEQTCLNGMDHFVGNQGCGFCGRLKLACARRPCQAMRAH